MGKELDILAILAENAALKATLAEYKVLFAMMEEKITKLEQLVASYQVKKDSHNSSLPPSTDLVKPNQSLRPRKSERKRGGQIGHKGSSLKMSDTPDQIIVIEPQFCNKCGNDLSDIESSLDSRRQVIEIPPVNPLYIEYQSFKKICTCGHCQVSHYPETVTNHIQYGASVQAIIAYESVRQYTPFKRLKEKLSFLYKLELSEGTIRNVLHSMAHLLRDLNYLIALEKTPWAQMILELFQKALLKNREYLFQFLYYRDVPPDNNASERAVRNLKVKQKVSGQFNGAQQDFAVLRSVIDTIIKLQGNLFQTLLLIANYKPDPIVAE